MLWLLAALVAATGLPYAFRGPGFIVDDWYTINWRWADGLLATGGWGQLRARPGAWLTYLVEFGLVGRHPVAIYLVQLGLDVACAYLLFRVAARYLPRAQAFALSAVWVLLPNHMSLDHWASTMNIQLALLLLLGGILLLDRAVERSAAPWAAVGLFAVSALFYEATLPLAGTALLVGPWLRGRPPRWPELVRWELPLVAVGAWMLYFNQHVLEGWFHFDLVFSSHFGWGLTAHGGQIVGVLAAVAIAVIVIGRALPSVRPVVPTQATALVVAGLATILLGLVPFARYPIGPIGLGDRTNVVAALGSAAVWVGIGTALWRRRTLVLVLAVVLAVLAVDARFGRDRDYSRSARDALLILRAVGRAYPTTPHGVIQVGPTTVYHHGVTGLVGVSSQAAAPYLRRPGILVNVSEDRRDYYSAPPWLRLDVTTILAGRS